MKILRAAIVAGIFTTAVYPQTDWPAYGHDQSGQRYSPLTKINTRNVSKLHLAWQYGIDPGSVDLDAATRALTSTEAVPIMVGGILYTPTVHHTIVALEPETGKEIWKYDLAKARARLCAASPTGRAMHRTSAGNSGRHQRRAPDRAQCQNGKTCSGIRQ